jgi:NDP-sugar pyrophosphorylase family protein
MEAVILAGGKGTRLQPYTSDIPKPLVPLENTPIVEILLRRLRKGGVTRAHVAVNHLAHLVMAVLGDGSKLGIEITYSVEDRPLGTVGPLRLIADLPEHFIVANGDVISDIPIDRLFDFHIAHQGLVTVATHRRTERIDFGVLESDSSGRVVGFTEKPSYHFSVSMGIYVFSRDVMRYVPDGKPFGFDELILTLLAKGERVMNYPYEGFWLDIGRPDDYERAVREYSTIEQLLK